MSDVVSMGLRNRLHMRAWVRLHMSMGLNVRMRMAAGTRAGRRAWRSRRRPALFGLNNVMRELMSSPQVSNFLLHGFLESLFLIQDQRTLFFVIFLAVPVILASAPPLLPGMTAGKTAVLPGGAALFTSSTALGALTESAAVATDKTEDAGHSGKGGEGHENSVQRARSVAMVRWWGRRTHVTVWATERRRRRWRRWHTMSVRTAKGRRWRRRRRSIAFGVVERRRSRRMVLERRTKWVVIERRRTRWVVVELMVGRRTVSGFGMNFSERLFRTAVIWREVRAVHAAVVMVVRAGTEMDVDYPDSTVRLMEKSLKNARNVVAGLQFVLQRVCVLSHMSMDDFLLMADALLDLLLLGLELAEKLNLVLNGRALVEEALGKIVEVNGDQPEACRRIAPALTVQRIGESDGVGSKPEELDLASSLLEGDGKTGRVHNGLVVDLLDVDRQDLSDIASVLALVRFRKRFKQTGSFPGEVEVVVRLMFGSGLV